RNGLNLLDVSAFWQMIVIGVVIVVAVWIDVLRQRVGRGAGSIGDGRRAGRRGGRARRRGGRAAGAAPGQGGGGGGGGGRGGEGRPAAKEIEIALVTKAMDSEFWLVLADGAKAAAAARPGVKLLILAPDREINIDQQVSILEDQTRRGVKALVVSPAGSAQV